MSAQTELGISKANDAPSQFIRLFFEGAYNVIHEDQKQIAELRKAGLLPPAGK